MKNEITSTERASGWENPERFVVDKFSAARTRVDGSLKDMAAYAQLHPGEALMWAVGGGYLLRMLPLTGIFGGLVRTVLKLVKPAAFIYGVSKVWQKAQPVIAPRKMREMN